MQQEASSKSPDEASDSEIDQCCRKSATGVSVKFRDKVKAIDRLVSMNWVANNLLKLRLVEKSPEPDVNAFLTGIEVPETDCVFWGQTDGAHADGDDMEVIASGVSLPAEGTAGAAPVREDEPAYRLHVVRDNRVYELPLGWKNNRPTQDSEQGGVEQQSREKRCMYPTLLPISPNLVSQQVNCSFDKLDLQPQFQRSRLLPPVRRHSTGCIGIDEDVDWGKPDEIPQSKDWPITPPRLPSVGTPSRRPSTSHFVWIESIGCRDPYSQTFGDQDCMHKTIGGPIVTRPIVTRPQFSRNHSFGPDCPSPSRQRSFVNPE